MGQGDLEEMAHDDMVEFNWSFPVEGSKTDEWVDVKIIHSNTLDL